MSDKNNPWTFGPTNSGSKYCRNQWAKHNHRHEKMLFYRKVYPLAPRGPMSRSIYFAGDLFNHKDLIGNFLLSGFISQLSEGAYEPILPQDAEAPGDRAKDIRNSDIKSLLLADCALFNFDGTDLDSGTVVEFMIAKFLDIPAVILRTDFRKAGDQESGGDNWNLMCSFYPRTEIVEINSLGNYQSALDTEGNFLQNYYTPIAQQIIEKLDKAFDSATLTTINPLPIDFLVPWLISACGGELHEIIDDDELLQIIERRKGVAPTE